METVHLLFLLREVILCPGSARGCFFFFFSFFFLVGTSKVGPRLGFPFLIDLLLLYRHASSLEGGEFAGRAADFLWFLVLGGLFALAGALLLNWVLLFKGMRHTS